MSNFSAGMKDGHEDAECLGERLEEDSRYLTDQEEWAAWELEAALKYYRAKVKRLNEEIADLPGGYRRQMWEEEDDE